MEKYKSIVDQIDRYLGIASDNDGVLSEPQCKHLRELIWGVKSYGEPAEKWIKLANDLLSQQKLTVLMVADGVGKLPKRVIKKLKQVSGLNWRYETIAYCYVADITSYEEAKFVSMKIIAALAGELPHCYCSFVDLATNKTLFTFDRLNGYRPKN